MKVSTCMIVKDEAKYIERALASIIDKCYEVIVVDTGSTDNTVEIIKEKFPAVKVFTYVKDKFSFANARNFSISKAKGKWVFYMDADEEFVGEFPENLDLGLYNFSIRNLADNGNFVESQCSRLAPNVKGMKFEGDVHEIFAPDKPLPIFKLPQEQCHIKHYGYLNEIREEKNKSERNLVLLEEQYGKEPNAPNCYYLAQEVFIVGNHQRALDLSLEGIAAMRHDNALDKTFEALLYHAAVSAMIQLDEGEQLEEFAANIPENVYHPEIHIAMMDFYSKKDDEGKVLSNYSKAVMGQNWPQLPAKCADHVTTVIPNAIIGNYFMKKEDKYRALYFFEKAVELGCRDAGVLHNMYNLMPKNANTIQKNEFLLGELHKVTQDSKFLVELSNVWLNTGNIEKEMQAVETLKALLPEDNFELTKARLIQSKKGYLFNPLDQDPMEYELEKIDVKDKDLVTVVMPTMLMCDKGYVQYNINELTNNDLVKEIIIIDNTGEKKVKNEVFLSNKCRVIENEENIGVNPAWNQGVAEVTTPFYLVLNDDCLVRKEIIDTCFSGMINIEDVGIITCHTMQEDLADYKNKMVAIEKDIFRTFNGLGRNTHGWFIFGKTDQWVEIPKELHIFYGDDLIHWIARKNDRKVLKVFSNYVSHAVSTTVISLDIYKKGLLETEKPHFENIKEKLEKEMFNAK